MFRASARLLRKDEVRIPIMILGAFLTLYLGSMSVLGSYSFFDTIWSSGRIDHLGVLSVVAAMGLVAAWLRVSLPRTFQTSRTLRAFVVVALLLAVVEAAYLLIVVFPAMENPFSWMFGAAAAIGVFLIMATVGEDQGAL